jgi:hypothetical protein
VAYNDIYRLRVYGRLHGAQIVNVMHFVQNNASPGLGAQELANDYRDNMLAASRSRASSQFLFETVEVQSIVPFTGAAAVAAWPGGTVGQRGGAVTSATLAEVITIYTSRAGRRGRGRVYLAGAESVGTGMSSGGVWNSAQTALTVAFATALATRYIDPLNQVNWSLGVWSRRIAGPDPPWPTDAFARATGLTVRTIMRTQRRRQVGVGR